MWTSLHQALLAPQRPMVPLHPCQAVLSAASPLCWARHQVRIGDSKFWVVITMFSCICVAMDLMLCACSC